MTDRVSVAAEALSDALERTDFAGWDPYDALASPVLRKAARAALLRQLVIQTIKGLPVNIRPLLRIPEQQHTKALALLVSAYARLASAIGDDRYRGLVGRLVERLVERGIPTAGGLGWGYDFDVQTRWGYYRRGEPNSVVTAFAAHALLDAEESGADGYRNHLEKALDFASSLLVSRDDGQFFGYFAGSTALIHNANLLLAAVFARAARGSEPAPPAVAALEYSLARQRPDGSWPYGEGRGLGWVDGYHTAYVLRSLAWWDEVAGDAPIGPAIASGLDLYLDRLIDPDGAPRATVRRRYPLDIHSAATAVWALSELRTYDERALPSAERVLDWTLANMRRPDGRFAYQQRRFFRNSVPYVRWNDAHMLLALSSYLRATQTTAA